MKLTLFSLLIFLVALTSWADTHVVGDLEGNTRRLEVLVEEGKLKWVETPEGRRLRFVKPGDSLVFLGDLSGPNWADRANPRNIQLRELLLDLRTQNPGRVDLILGNHEYNRLSFVRDNIRIDRGEHPEYKKWLAEGKIKDTVTSRVQFWAQQFYGRPDESPLHLYQLEMKARLGREVSLDEAAKAFADDLSPGGKGKPPGKMLQYIMAGEEFSIRGDMLMSHGPLTPEAMGRVPLSSVQATSGQDWVAKRNELYFRPQLDNFVKDAQAGRVPSDILIALGDAQYDPDSKLVSHPTSSVYNDRPNTFTGTDPKQSQPRAIRQTVGEFLSDLRGVISGHKPAGNFVTLYRQFIGSREFLDVAGDTSRGPQGLEATFTLKDNGDIEIGGKTVEGERVRFTVRAGDNSPIGLVTEDGYHIKGVTEDGRFITERMVGYNVEQKVVPKSTLGSVRPSNPDIGTDVNSARRLEAIEKTITERSGRILKDPTDIKKLINGRFVLDFSGEAQFSKLTKEQIADLRKNLTQLANELDPKKVVILKRGNIVQNSATVENLVSEIFGGRTPPFDMIGVALPGTAAGDLDKHVSNFIITEAGSNFDDAFKVSQGILRTNRGASVVIGGAGIIDGSLNTFEASVFGNDKRLFLVQGFGGASETTKVPGERVKLSELNDRIVGETTRQPAVPTSGPDVVPTRAPAATVAPNSSNSFSTCIIRAIDEMILRSLSTAR